jgi:ABC-type lipoprotein export system ATPase subunit/bifunctional DNA-binding transcriptional regulator/antitoxin component of YhaV-PrlF toxin-antitoxin module
MGSVLLDCKDVIKIYKSTANTKIPALRGIDLSIKESEIIALIGPSGSGKTTFINVLGLIEHLSSGEIIYESHLGYLKYSEVKLSDKIRFRREIFGYLFQQPEMNLFYHLPALRNVTFPMKILGKLVREEQKKRALELLKIFNLEDKRKNYPSQLSGGETQRLGICVALANDPQILLTDEPTGELDSLNTYAIIDYFNEVNHEFGKTIVIVTHDPRFASKVDFIYKIQDGKIISLYQPRNQTERNNLELTFVSEKGEIIIPSSILNQYSINRMVKIEAGEFYLKIISPTGNKTKKRKLETSEEFTPITRDGALIIPTKLRKKYTIKDKVYLETTSEFIRIIPL